MDEPAAGHRSSIVKRLLQGVEDEPCMSTARHTPADDAAGVGVDDEGDVNEAGPGRDIGEVGDPERIRPRRLELAVDPELDRRFRP